MRTLWLGAASAAVLALGACSDNGYTTSGASTSTTAAPTYGGSAPAAAPASSAPASSMTSLSAADVSFIFQAAYGGTSEVQLGQLAQGRATSPMVRDLGTRMVQDHSAANQELIQLAQAKGVQPPGAPDHGHQVAYDILASLNGANFDREYVKDQVAEHRMAVALFQVEAQNGDDPTLKAFARRTLPALQSHLDMFVHAATRPMVSAR